MLKIITNRWFIRALALLGLAGIVNLLGPLFSFGAFRPLGTLTGQIIFLLLIVVGWLASHLWKVHRSSKAEKKLVTEMAAPPLVPEGPDVSAEERDKIRKRFEEAMAVLRRSRGRKGRLNLYDLPWYILIGPPGSGKTTALVNSGLRFPLADRYGPDAIRGVGGTRNCDWWFTDDAVLIDTAGRFTTQDSDAKVDRAGWTGFLDLLKTHRKRRPINGIIVALSVTDLVTQNETERRAQLTAVKERVAELDQHFGIRFPVYVLFTKCDLVAGFTEFFDDLARAEREQVWGITFQHSDDPDANPAAAFESEYDLLLQRLNQRMLARIAQERDLQRRGLMHGFPQQMAALKDSCAAFLHEAFEGSRYSKGSMLRGVYFTSGTQEGTPIDRLMGVLARTFRLDAQALPAHTGGGKSFFITDALRKVAFPEAELAGASRRVERQRAWLQRGTYAGVAAVLVLLLVAWAFAFFSNSAYIERMREATARAGELVAAVDSRNYDPLSVVPALDAVRALPGGYADRAGGGSWFGSWGLSQSDKLGETAVASYRRLLNQLFLPRVMLRLEGQLQRGGASADYVYEALKAYLMLDSKDHYDPAAIRAFIELDWDANLQRAVGTEQRQALSSHLAATFEQRPMPLPLPLNDAVIVQARREVRSLPLDERIYGRLKRTFAADIRGFNIRDAAGGPTAEFVFVRKSGVPLDTPVPPLFTKEAYQNVFVERSQALVRELAAESWILGEEQRVAAEEEERLLALVRDRYLTEFAALYTEAIVDVGLIAFGTPQDAARIMNLLSRPADSPLVLLLQEISRQTSLDQRDDDQAAAAAGGAVAQVRDRLRDVIGGGGRPAQAAAPPATNPVTERFGPISDLVAARDGQPRPIDHLLGLLRDLYDYLTVAASEAAGGALPPSVQQQGQAVLQQLRAEAALQPNLLIRDMLQSTAENATALTTGGLMSFLNEQWRSGPLTECRQAIAGRYPIVASSQQEIRLADFGEFFGYGGHLDRFFNEHLRQYIDMTETPWRPRVTANAPVQLSAATLRAFENADVVRRTFFRAGSTEPTVSFDLKPLEMDTRLSRFLLDLEGQVVVYEFGPMDTDLMRWPGPTPGEVRIEMRDRQSGGTTMTRRTGPWAWFRLLEGNLTRTAAAEEFELTFSQDDRTAIYQLTARSAYNPFELPQLQSFECPNTL